MMGQWLSQWLPHGIISAIVIGVGRWIVGHVKDIKVKLNGYIVDVHHNDEAEERRQRTEPHEPERRRKHIRPRR